MKRICQAMQKPMVQFDGKTYALKSEKAIVPDLTGMSRIEALVWLNRNVVRRGYQKSRPTIAAGVGVA